MAEGTLTREIINNALNDLWAKKIEPEYFECSAQEAPVIKDWIEHPEKFKEVIDRMADV